MLVSPEYSVRDRGRTPFNSLQTTRKLWKPGAEEEGDYREEGGEVQFRAEKETKMVDGYAEKAGIRGKES